MKNINIIGAGFSGLSLAYFLEKKGFQVTIIEKNARPGGLIYSEKVNDNLIEQAANSILLTKDLEELLADINLDYIRPDQESKKRYFLRSGNLKRWPLNFWESTLFFIGLFKLKFLKRKSHIPLDVTFSKVFNSNIDQYLLSPGLQGIYATQSHQLSTKLILKKRDRSKGIVSFKDGMYELILKLESHLKKRGVSFSYNKSIDHIDSSTTVIATSNFDSSLLSHHFKNLPQTNLSIVNLIFKDKSSIEGFGILFPRKENINSLGVINNSIFQNRSNSEAWIINSDEPEEVLKKKVLSDRKRIFPNSQEPIHIIMKKHANTYPLYGLELEKSLNNYKSEKGLYFTGNYLGNLGLSGILSYNKKLSLKIEQDLL